jgi:hypothetical protein
MKPLKDIKKGDIFYTLFNKQYYFFQIIHITKDLPPPYDIDYKFGYFIILFEKSYGKLPESIQELDLVNIYVTKYYRKNEAMFISYWNNVPEIRFNPQCDDYKKYLKNEVTYFGNEKVSNSFNPKIQNEFSMPSCHTVNDDGITISHSPSYFEWIFHILENDNKMKKVEMEKFKVKFKDIIKKFETIENKSVAKRELKKCVSGINKLDSKFHFIETTEAEKLYEKLMKISISKGLSEEEAEKIIEDNRDW